MPADLEPLPHRGDIGRAGLLRRFAVELEVDCGPLPADKLERRARSC